jgi:hypothetical protein
MQLRVCLLWVQQLAANVEAMMPWSSGVLHQVAPPAVEFTASHL